MTREEAIKWMEEAIQDTNTHWDSCSEALQKELNEQREVFLLAIDAMLHTDRKQKLEAENMKLKERIIHWQKYMAPTREQVEKVWNGCTYCMNDICSLLNWKYGLDYVLPNYKFCPMCGRPLTDKAVEMTMKRMKELKDGKGD